MISTPSKYISSKTEDVIENDPSLILTGDEHSVKIEDILIWCVNKFSTRYDAERQLIVYLIFIIFKSKN